MIDEEATDLVVECDGAGNVDQLDAWLASNGGTGAASDVCSGGVVWTHNFVELSDDCGATGSARNTAFEEAPYRRSYGAFFDFRQSQPPFSAS